MTITLEIAFSFAYGGSNRTASSMTSWTSSRGVILTGIADFINTKLRGWLSIGNIAYMCKEGRDDGLSGTRRACFAWKVCSLLNGDILDDDSGGEKGSHRQNVSMSGFDSDRLDTILHPKCGLWFVVSGLEFSKSDV
jgi:hypothetical protein